MDWTSNAGMWWLIAGVAMAITELLVPGVYLIFFALAGAITGAMALLFPGLGLPGQLASFAAWSVVTVLIGRRWYRDYPVETQDPLLNDRVARLIGETVTVVEPIQSGCGRVRVGDSEWLARGVDQPVGARVRITGASGNMLHVEPVPTLPA